MENLIDLLNRQCEWSWLTFGPSRDGDRERIVDHIRKELADYEAAERLSEELEELVDIVLLALDGAWRAGFTPENIWDAIAAKQALNMQRDWPDWRKCAPGKAIEHIRVF